MSNSTSCPFSLPPPGTRLTIEVPEEPDRRRRLILEDFIWTFVGAELGEDGFWYAVLTREAPNSYDDVMNGTGTGLGSYTVTERVRITENMV